MIAAMTITVIAVLFFSNAGFASMSTSLCKDQARYTCHVVQRGESWDTLFPYASQKDLVMRINRMNISLRPTMKIAIPKNLSSSDLMDYAPFPTKINPPGEKIIIVSLNSAVLAWGAYSSQGKLEHWGPASGGRGWCPDVNRGCHTKFGKFFVYHKRGEGCKSSKFPVPRGGAPMPYCMFFYGGFALHGSHEVPGYNASHGCIRLFVSDAKWLNQEFIVGNGRVPVIVHGKI